MSTKSSTPENIIIEPRRPDFDFSDTTRYWLRDPFASHFMNALSIVVPFSERTVIEIVRKYRSCISDPKLARDMDALIRQEGRHTLLHLKCNELLQSCGYPGIRPFVKIQQLFVRCMVKISPPAWELAIPASFEHFTSAISKHFIENKDFWAGDKTNAAVDFADWHALEEIEHQAVCFDFFSAIEKRRWLLTFSLLFVWMPATLVSVYGIQLYFLLKDGLLSNLNGWRSYLSFVLKTLPMLTRGPAKYLDKQYAPWNEKDKKTYRSQREKLLPKLSVSKL